RLARDSESLDRSDPLPLAGMLTARSLGGGESRRSRSVRAFSRATYRSYSANAAASQTSASDFGNSVPCHAATVCTCSSRSCSLSLSRASSRVFRSAATTDRSDSAGEPGCRIVHGLLTSGRISGNRRRSSCVGSQVTPSGGPNNAHVSIRLAIAVVVYLASSEWAAARGAVVNASRPKSAPIFPLCFSYSLSQTLSRSDGRQTRF